MTAPVITNPAAASNETRVLREQLRLIYEHLPFVLLGNFVAASCVVAALWVWSPHAVLLGWAAAVYCTSLARFFVYRAFLAQPGDFDTQRWGLMATLLSGLSGCLWGSLGVLFFQHEPAVVMILVITLGGMAAGSVSSHSCHLPTYIAYAVPAVLPFSLRCIAEMETFYVALGVMSLTFIAVNVNYGKNLQRTLKESVRLRFQNNALVAELTLQKDMAERANMAKTRFLAAASHDLRQPVQTIEFFLDALNHDLKDHPSRPLLDRIRIAGRGLETLLNALLDVSKIDAAAIHPEKSHFPAADLLGRLHADFMPLANARGLDLRVVPSRTWLHSDQALLERILRNFMSNAIKYTPHGKVLLGCRREKGTIRIEVHDSGIGIPQQAQKEVFREFYQLDNPERDREKGLGLGLSIAHGLASLLEHSLQLQSELGRGSVFSVTVPNGMPQPIKPNASAMAMIHDALRGKTVLLIDDDASIRDGAAEMLERWDCAAVTAGSASEALELIGMSGFSPDAIIADYRLRDGLTGVDAIHALHASLGKVPAAILTGDTAPDRLNEARASGFPLAHKPLTTAKLRTLLSGLLSETALSEASGDRIDH